MTYHSIEVGLRLEDKRVEEVFDLEQISTKFGV